MSIREKIMYFFRKDQVFQSGSVSISLIDKNGNIKERTFVRNLVVATGLSHLADRLEDTPDETAMGYLAIGNDATPASAVNTGLGGELGRVAITSKIQGTGGNSNQITVTATVPAGVGTGTIVEAGIFNASSNGIMFARSVFSPKVKGAGDALGFSWVFGISAS